MRAFPAGCLFVLLIVAPCFTSSAGVGRRVAFNEADYAAYLAPGTATVTGRLAVSTQDGVREGNGVSVELVPVTPYTTEMVEMELGRGVLLSPRVDPRFQKYARFATTDDHGNFVIRGVPPGRYFICGEVDWLPAAATDYSAQWALEQITVGKGKTVHIDITHNPNHGHDIQMIQTLR